MTTNNYQNRGFILPTNVVGIIVRYVDILFAQNTTQTLIGGELKTAPAFTNVSASWNCCVNKLTAHLALGSFIVRRFVGNFVLVWMVLQIQRLMWGGEEFDVYDVLYFYFIIL